MTELARQPLAGRLPRSLTSRAGLRNPAAAQVPASRRGEPPAVCSRQNFEPTLTAPECKPASGVYLRKRAQRCCSRTGTDRLTIADVPDHCGRSRARKRREVTVYQPRRCVAFQEHKPATFPDTGLATVQGGFCVEWIRRRR